jgi:hypothetical protein
VNLNAWPATFLIVKDGLVHAVKTGFTSSSSAEFDRDAKARNVGNIDKLQAKKTTQPATTFGYQQPIRT